MSSSVPQALDYLAHEIATLDVVRQMRAAVTDGWPAVSSDQLIVVGITPEDSDTGIVASYAELSRDEYEDVAVPGLIAVHRAGSQAASDARRDAFALLDAISDLVRADRRLGESVRPGLPARISGYEMVQTAAAEPAGGGRWCEIRWTVAWQHRC